jgi:hypothetical protein
MTRAKIVRSVVIDRVNSMRKYRDPSLWIARES